MVKKQAKTQQTTKKTTTGTRVRKKIHRTVPMGIAHVKATFNNTVVTITDLSGNIISWATAGRCGYKGSKKSSAFAGTVAAQTAAKEAMNFGMKECEVCLKGPGAGRESAVRGLQSSGLIVTIIRDNTPVPHNGCRPRKRRRV